MPEKRIPRKATASSRQETLKEKTPSKGIKSKRPPVEEEDEEMMEQERPRVKETSSKKTRSREETPQKTPSKKSKSRRPEPEPEEEEEEEEAPPPRKARRPEPEPEEEEEEEAPPRKARPGGNGGSNRAGGSGKKPAKKQFKKNNVNLILLVSTVLLIALGITALVMRPKSKTTVIRFDPNKSWKTAESIGKEGLRLYQDGLALRDQANSDSSSPKYKEYVAKWQEANAKLAQGCELGEKAVFLGLCVLLNMSEEDSESWITRYKKTSTELDDFGDFMAKNKMIPEGKQKEILEEWRKKTGGYQEKMGVWQEKRYDINKNRRKGDEEE